MITMLFLTTAAATKGIPEEIMKLGGTGSAMSSTDLFDSAINCGSDSQVLFGRNFSSPLNILQQLRVFNLDCPKPQVTSNFVIVHRSAKMLNVAERPSAFCSHQFEKEAALFPDRIAISVKCAKQRIKATTGGTDYPTFAAGK